MSIYKKQNEERMLSLNKTKKCLYSRAKVISTVWITFITVIACVFIILVYFIDNRLLKIFSFLSGGVFFVLSLAVNKYVNDLKWLAAGIQQRFDYHVLGIDENIPAYRLMGLHFPKRELIAKYEGRFKDKKVSGIENWYNDYSNLSKSNQILCCQKENFRWESKLKNITIYVYITCSIFLLSAIILVGILTNNVYNMYCVSSWILPICQQMISFIRILCNDKKRLIKIKAQIDYAETIKSDENRLYQEVSNLQALIFEHRIKGFLVPDFIYKLTKKKMQADEIAIANDINNN